MHVLPARQWMLFGTCVLILCALFLAVQLWPVPHAEAGTIGYGTSSFKELSGRFVSLAERKGAAYAYEVLRRADLRPGTDIHLLGHVVGDELYKQQGVDGISLCTQEFRNACSHSVVIGALQEFGSGEATLSLIDDACKKAPGGKGAYTMCYHGLGHGVFAFFGYDLEKTIAFCKRAGTPQYRGQQYTECVGGAIMELMGGGGHDQERWNVARELYLTDDPLSPCNGEVLPEDVKGYCYMYLTPKLFESAGATLASPDPATFPRAFSFCEAIPVSRQTQRNSCFGGFGKEFVPLAGARDIRAIDSLSNEAYAKAGSWCQSAAPADGQKACIHQALESVFWGGESDPRASFRFCEVSPQGLQASCYERLAQNIRRYLPEETQAQWCVRLDQPYQVYCAPGAAIVYE